MFPYSTRWRYCQCEPLLTVQVEFSFYSWAAQCAQSLMLNWRFSVVENNIVVSPDHEAVAMLGRLLSGKRKGQKLVNDQDSCVMNLLLPDLSSWKRFLGADSSLLFRCGFHVKCMSSWHSMCRRLPFQNLRWCNLNLKSNKALLLSDFLVIIDSHSDMPPTKSRSRLLSKRGPWWRRRVTNMKAKRRASPVTKSSGEGTYLMERVAMPALIWELLPFLKHTTPFLTNVGSHYHSTTGMRVPPVMACARSSGIPGLMRWITISN